MIPLAGKRIVVVGCTTGIGRALALELARAGARLTLFGRREDELRRVAAEAGGEVDVVVGDTRDAARVRETCARLEAPFGLVYSAGVSHVTRVRAFDAAEARDVMETNYFGLLAWVEALLPGLMARREGFILGVTALCAYRGIPSGAVYSASKGAMSNFLEGLRLDLEPYGVRVVDVMPGFIDTPLSRKNTHISMPLMISAEGGARTIVRALARGEARIEVPWTHSWMFWVAKNLPSWLYPLLFRGYVFGRHRLELALEALPPLVCPTHARPLAWDRYGAWSCATCGVSALAVRDRFNVVDGTDGAPDPGPRRAPREATAFVAERLRATTGPVVIAGAGDARLLRAVAADPARPLLCVDASRRASIAGAKALAGRALSLHYARDPAALNLPPGSARTIVCLDARALGHLATLLAPGGELCGVIDAASAPTVVTAGLRTLHTDAQGASLLFRATRDGSMAP